VKEVYEDRLLIEWHAFSLEKVNGNQEADWKLGEQPDEYKSRGL